jgi:drug/metabolite transporter (DMT)-like permease
MALAMTAQATTETSQENDDPPLGVGLVLLSAASFGAITVLAQLAYRSGVPLLGLLGDRFVIAAAALWLLTAALRRPRPGGRALAVGVALSGGYSVNALFLFASLRHIEAGLADLLYFASSRPASPTSSTSPIRRSSP